MAGEGSGAAVAVAVIDGAAGAFGEAVVCGGVDGRAKAQLIDRLHDDAKLKVVARAGDILMVVQVKARIHGIAGSGAGKLHILHALAVERVAGV